LQSADKSHVEEAYASMSIEGEYTDTPGTIYNDTNGVIDK
jgi:hypothetical protein